MPAQQVVKMSDRRRIGSGGQGPDGAIARQKPVYCRVATDHATLNTTPRCRPVQAGCGRTLLMSTRQMPSASVMTVYS